MMQSTTVLLVVLSFALVVNPIFATRPAANGSSTLVLTTNGKLIDDHVSERQQYLGTPSGTPSGCPPWSRYCDKNGKPIIEECADILAVPRGSRWSYGVEFLNDMWGSPSNPMGKVKKFNCDNRDLKKVGFNACMLMGSGSNEEFGSQWVSVTPHTQDWWNRVKALRWMAFSLEELKECGCTAKDFKMARESSAMGKSPDFPYDKIENLKLEFTLKELKEAGYTKEALQDEGGFTKQELKDVGFQCARFGKVC